MHCTFAYMMTQKALRIPNLTATPCHLAHSCLIRLVEAQSPGTLSDIRRNLWPSCKAALKVLPEDLSTPMDRCLEDIDRALEAEGVDLAVAEANFKVRLLICVPVVLPFCSKLMDRPTCLNLARPATPIFTAS